jgi:sulfate transport system substrate-binding protein
LIFTWACGDSPSDARRPTGTKPESITLEFGAFSAAHEAFATRVLPAFHQQWLRLHGQSVRFQERYEGSEALTRAIASGLQVDVAVLALSRDMERLVAAGMVDAGWRDAPNHGIVSRSIVVLAVRKGNPSDIRDWTDLVRPGVRIVIADPATSGGGIWFVCAIYGAALRGHAGVTEGDPATARAFVAQVLANVVERKASADEAFKSFQSGSGDVAITYESQVAFGWMNGHEEERVIPASTALVENPAVLLSRNADAHGVRTAAEGLLAFLWTAEAQKMIAFCGLRPVNEAIAADTAQQFPRPQDLWTIEDLGGWDQLNRDLLVPGGFTTDERPPK